MARHRLRLGSALAVFALMGCGGDESGGGGGGVIIPTTTPTPTPTPVSYTHLDVYKRQCAVLHSLELL